MQLKTLMGDYKPKLLALLETRVDNSRVTSVISIMIARIPWMEIDFQVEFG